MAVSASTGVMSSLLSKLSELLSDQYKQRKGLRRDIEFLSHELTDMNAALEKLADRDKLDVQTKAWRDKVREMAYDIEDCIDIFMHRLSQGDDKDGLFHKIASKIRELREHYQLANKIKELKARVEEQSQSRDRYKIDESISNSTVVEVDPRLPALFEDAKRLVGIDGPREEITKWLMEEGDSDSKKLLKVVSIVGFGGLGKTTLANQVHAKIKAEFQCTAFVSVSRTPHMQKILKDILFGVGYSGTEMEDDVYMLIQILRAQLTNKRYLIIIDDLWSTKDWRTLECTFVDNNNGSRVITTTRNQDVARACCFPSQGHVYPMQPLDDHHSRRLFFKRLFDTEDNCPEQFKMISNDMLRKCKGVPLAITSIASLLANKSMHVETWEKILNSLGFELNINPTLEWMRHVLSLSYNDLPYELKTCFLYLGIYPEDWRIMTHDLMRKWIAEGFVKGNHGLDPEETAKNYLNGLINRSMIQPCFISDSGEVGDFKVHDLMLDLIISKCKEENFITVIDNKYTVNETSRLISHQFGNRDMVLAVERMSARVRSYNSFPTADCMHQLSKFELLRVLDMDKGSSIGPESMLLDLSAINNLFLLRYLRVHGFRLLLPKKFKNLKHLMTLDMSFISLDPYKQFSDFSSLSSLRYLALPTSGLSLKNGLSKLCNLHDLSGFCIETNSVECIRDLGELTNLRELSVFYCKSSDVEDNRETVLAASIDKLGNNNLRHLQVTYQVVSGVKAPSTQSLSNCLTRPRHLQSLILDGLIHKVPNWIVYADRLAQLDLLVQELRNEDIQILAQLSCLIYLWLVAKTIPEENIIIHQKTFPSLKLFQFHCELSCLTFEPTAMPLLRRLFVELDGRGQGGMKLQEGSPIGGIEHLASLEVISVRICGHGSEIVSAWRDAISRHPKSEALEIHLDCTEFDENGEEVRDGGIGRGD